MEQDNSNPHYFVAYMLDEKNKWRVYHAEYQNPSHQAAPIPKPDLSDLMYQEGNIVYIKKGEIVRQCVVQGVLIYFHFWEPERGWIILYDLKWNSSGHNHGWIEEKYISGSKNDWDEKYDKGENK